MASTYSQRLRLELMATGDQSSTWGITTNTNLGNLIDQAIAGISSVVMPSDANYTLTNINGASDESRHAMISITSAVTLTAVRSVICPSGAGKTKFWLVQNLTNQGITFRTVSGFGVNLSPGQRRLVYCDGVNVRSQETSEIPVGTIIDYAGNAIPEGWFFCTGQALSRTQFADLFAAIGTIWGAGDGVSTFNLPDTRGRVLASPDAMGGTPANRITIATTTIGSGAGNQNLHTHTHTITDPGHVHGVGDPGHVHGISDPGHSHSAFDAGHNHSINNPGHSHGLTDPGHNHTIVDPGHVHGVTDPGHIHGGNYIRNLFGSFSFPLGGLAGFASSDVSGTGISINVAGTGISNAASGTGMSVSAVATAISANTGFANIGVNGSLTGVSAVASGTGVSVVSGTTGITAANAGQGNSQNLQPVAFINKIIKW